MYPNLPGGDRGGAPERRSLRRESRRDERRGEGGVTAGELARHLAVLEARRGGPQAPAFPDGIAVAASGDLAVDVLEAVVREWPAIISPPGCARCAPGRRPSG